MAQSSFDTLLAPLIDLVMLARRAVRFRVALAKQEAALRLSSIMMAVTLGLVALILVVMATGLAVQAGLLGLAALGLTPMQALLAAMGACLVLALILLLVVRALIRRATRPFSLTPGLDGGLARSDP